jgi:predicted flap endonuclease-1-like 5' DNA nuclease
MAYKIDEIQGIGPAFKAKLTEAKIETTDDLLEHCADSSGRKSISERTGLSESQLLDWSNMADMMRISGVGPQFAELLEASGVDTVKELQHRNAENLAAKISEINSEKKLAKSSPAASTVQEWIEQAKTLKPTIKH